MPSSKAAVVFHTLSKGWPGRSSIARVERAPSERARSASRRMSRLPFLSFFSSRLTCETGCLPIDNPHSCQDQCDAEDFAHAH